MFFIPLFDDNPSRRTPWVAWSALALCVIVFLWQQSLAPQGEALAFYRYGFVPANASGVAPLPPGLAVIPAWATMVTAMFLHGGWMHLGGNMLYLWIFGDNVEDSMGSFRFAVFYVLCGGAAALAQFMIDPASKVPMVGASGGIAGILGAYLILHPRAAVRTFVLILIFIRFINLPAWLVLGVWIAGQFVAVPSALAKTGGGGVAYFAHIGGFIAGMCLIPFFKRADVPLFGANDTPPERWDAHPIPFAEIKQEARHRYGRRGKTALGSRLASPPREMAAWSKPPKPNQRRNRSGSVPSFRKTPKDDG